MEKLFITDEVLAKLALNLISNGYNVIGIDEENRYKKLDERVSFFIRTSGAPSKISMKEHFIPKTESLFYYKYDNSGVKLADPKPVEDNIVVIGAKPCDAASLPILSEVFNWDYKDDFFNNRVDNSIVIGAECSFKDEYCFCESVGLGQSCTKGSDLFLTPVNNGNYEVEIVTEKGRLFAEKNSQLFSPEKPNASEGGHQNSPSQEAFSYKNVKKWLDNNFEHPYWSEAGEMCLGCGQCAFACPTCHCFDIVDEQNNSCSGRRAKNWDACQFSIFTKHASGHNPRDEQDKRYRQRINHKFKYYHDKFDEILCTGCGRCSRGCPVSTDILQILQNINQLQLAGN